MLVIVTSILHEAGHIIIGGGVKDFYYAPDLDILATKIIIQSLNIFSAVAGFIFSLPILLVAPRWFIFIMIFQSRWDFLYIIQELNPYGIDFGWTVVSS